MKFKVQLSSYDHDVDFGESCIYLSKSSLELLRLEQGGFVEINLFRDDDEDRSLRTRRCKCLLDDSKGESETVYLSPLLWFNFTDQLVGFDSLEEFYVTVGD